MAALNSQQNFMPSSYIFFSIPVRLKVIAFLPKKCQVEHTICDCNRLNQDIQTN